MRKFGLLIGAVFQLVTSFAMPLTLDRPVPICGYPDVISKTGEIEIVKRLVKPAAGDTTFFIYENISESSPRFIEAVFDKLMERDNIIVYGELSEIEANRISTSDAEQIIQALLFETPAGSINPARGILTNEIEIFGPLPDVNRDGKLIVLLTDIRDNFDQTDNPVYMAGYFDPLDQINSPGKGNFGDIMYIDSNPGNTADPHTLGIVAHELQHLIHYGADPNESTWLNEGMSEFAMSILGFDARSHGPFLRDTNRPLTSFDNSIADYAKVGLWTQYCYRQFGLDFIGSVVANSANSLDSYQQVLTSYGYNSNISTLMRNWFIANLINDSGLDQGIFGYGDLQIFDLYSDYFYGSFKAGEKINFTVKNSAAQYIQFFAGKNLSFELSFTEDPNFDLAIVKEDGGTAVELMNLSKSPFIYDDPSFGLTHSKVTFIPYWTQISALERNKECSFKAQVIGGIEETEIVYSDDLTYYIQLNNALAAEKFSATGNDGNRLAGIKFNVGYDFGCTIRILEALNQEPVATYEIVPSAGEWTSYYLPAALNFPDSRELIIAVGSADLPQSLGYSETGAGFGRAYLNTGSGYRNLSDYQVGSTSLEGDWMIGAILHREMTVEPLLKISPDVLYFWANEYRRQFEIRNLGGGAIDWWIDMPVPAWLSLSATSGTGLESIQKVTVNIDRTSLDPGLYDHLLKVNSSTAGTDSLLISVMQRNRNNPQAGLFVRDWAFPNSQLVKAVKVLNIGTATAQFALFSNDDALAFYPETGVVSKTDTVIVKVMLDWENIGSTRIPFRFFDGIDTLEYSFRYSGSVPVSDVTLKLFPVFPNPYVPSSGKLALIRFRLIDDSPGKLRIFNLRGEQVQSLTIAQPETGLHIYTWDGRNYRGQKVSSGVYFVTLEQRNRVACQKMLLLK